MNFIVKPNNGIYAVEADGVTVHANIGNLYEGNLREDQVVDAAASVIKKAADEMAARGRRLIPLTQGGL